MPSADYHIEFVHYPKARAELAAVREPVFIHEQGVPAAMEWDALDPDSIHILARSSDGTPIGTARLSPDRRIGRMAVLPAWRGRGVGSALLRHLIAHARTLGYPELVLHAQTHALGFYEGFGFTAFGQPFDEAGIAHRQMRLQLSSPDGLEPEAHRLLEIDGAVDLAQMSLELIGRARRELVIYSRDLDPSLLGTPAAEAALRRFAVGVRGALARILVQDLRRAVQERHALITLAQRLPSHFSIRVVEQEPDVQYPSAFLLNDSGGYLFRPIGTRFEATAHLQDSARQRQLLAYFNEVWERARPASELRPL